jgi:hypothetical protein
MATIESGPAAPVLSPGMSSERMLRPNRYVADTEWVRAGSIARGRCRAVSELLFRHDRDAASLRSVQRSITSAAE